MARARTRPRGAAARAPAVELLVLDVDGVLTDGRLYLGARGEALKAFHVRDGHGIKLLREKGIEVAVISGRRSAAVARRCRELGVRHLRQGVRDKRAALDELCAALALSLRSCAAVGDDTPDVPLLRAVGLAFAVADAHPQARAAAHHVTRLAGGCGAVREGVRLPPERPRMITRFWPLLIVLALVLGTILLGRSGPSLEPPATGDAITDDPGYAARDAEVVQSGADGRAVYRLRARVIRQLPRAQRVELEHLTMNYRTTQGAKWRLLADHGELPQDASEIEVDGSVHLSGPIEGSSAPLDVRTDHLTFNTRSEIVTTDAEVTLLWAAQQLVATGLIANLQSELVQLQSRVHGHFLPK